MPQLPARNRNPRSVYSLDLKYYVGAEGAAGDKPDHFALYRAVDGKRFTSLLGMSNVYQAVSSADSHRFAIVGLSPSGRDAPRRIEELVTYRLE